VSGPSPRRAPVGSTRVGAVIGDPVRHSRSPAIYNAAFDALDLDWVFVAFEVAAANSTEALAGARTFGIDWLSVTMPHKSAMARLVDELTDDAAALEAVNCIVRDGERFVGHNTDGPGFVSALASEAGFDPADRRCAVVGAGGAARAVVLALARAGASAVIVVNRTRARAVAAAALAGDRGVVGSEADLADADLVVNATPRGMAHHPGLPFQPSLLAAGQVVADLVYEPIETELLATARQAGITAVNGLGMLTHQAAIQFELATGSPPPLAVMLAAGASG
jgi:shikimate dehydrogenase